MADGIIWGPAASPKGGCKPDQADDKPALPNAAHRHLPAAAKGSDFVGQHKQAVVVFQRPVQG